MGYFGTMASLTRHLVVQGYYNKHVLYMDVTLNSLESINNSDTL